MVPTIFDVCQPRPDVLSGAVESDFAADLARVVRGDAGAEYADPVRFFANTYPTAGLRDLLANVCRRLSGAGGEAASIFRLDTSYGGGKTHGLIALAHAAAGMAKVPNTEEFIDPSLLPSANVRVAAFDGENADPTNGRAMGTSKERVLAHTPWGEIAFALAGAAGFERLRRSDEERVAPGSETLGELFGGEPTLILLDELSVYLRKVKGRGGANQLTAFLTSLFKAVESAPNAALVYTLAIGRDGRAVDAYSEENQFIADQVMEAESVSARKATLLNPTDEDEYPLVLRRRLFESVDEAGLEAALAAYHDTWSAHADGLDPRARKPETKERFRASYPFHPEVLDTLTEKAFTLSSFQRVRGMLRLLGRTVASLWSAKPADAQAIHLHHIDLGAEGIRQEIVTRLGQSAFSPAIASDIAGSAGNPSLAERIDAEKHSGLPPYASYIARTAFLHTLAFNEPLKGATPERIRYAVISPSTDFSFIEEARKAFVTESAFLDDRPGAPMRFVAEPNLTRLIQTEERGVDAGEVRAHLDDRIREIFAGDAFQAVRFPGGPFDVPDEAGDGRPRLVVLAYDGVSVGGVVEEVPELVQRIFEHRGAEGSAFRVLRNSLVFVAADEGRIEVMRRRSRRRLALRQLRHADRMSELAEHQRAKVLELESRSEAELALAVQQCYRHVFYPSRNRLPGSNVDLAYTVIDAPSSSDRPGAGQQQVVRVLRDLGKLRTREDEPDSPAYVRDRTPLRRGQMTTAALRNEFRRDPSLPMLIGDEVFLRGVRRGIELGEYIYTEGELVCGPDDPMVAIAIDEQATVLTMAFARNKGVWPRRAAPETPGGPEPPKPPGPEPEPEPEPPPQQANTVRAEGVLKEAFTKLWEQARELQFDVISKMDLRVFDPGDGFRLLPVVGNIPDTEKTVRYEGGYETREGGEFNLTFKGPVADADPLREFLLPQVRDSAANTLETHFEVVFLSGLALSGNAPEKLSERLARFATSAAFVEATAEASKEQS